MVEYCYFYTASYSFLLKETIDCNSCSFLVWLECCKGIDERDCVFALNPIKAVRQDILSMEYGQTTIRTQGILQQIDVKDSQARLWSVWRWYHTQYSDGLTSHKNLYRSSFIHSIHPTTKLKFVDTSFSSLHILIFFLFYSSLKYTVLHIMFSNI